VYSLAHIVGLLRSRDAWAALPLCAAATLACLCAAPAAADEPTHLYSIELIDRMPATYRLELPVQHPGRLVVEANWSGRRMASLRIDRPDGNIVRRVGQSPLRIETEVAPGDLDPGRWLLTVHAVATRGDAAGTLAISVPWPVEPAASERRASPATANAEMEAPLPVPWERPRTPPANLSGATAGLFESTERYRATVVGPAGESPADACGWQDDLLRFLAESRDDLLDRAVLPQRETLHLLERIVAAIERVEALRSSLDPVISGPPPRKPEKRRQWLVARREAMQSIEAEFDGLLATIRRGHVPELIHSEWPGRLVTCLAACQRHFEERVRLGEDQAVNRDLAFAQWDVFLRAVDALRLLTRVDSAGDVHYTRQ